jgi:maltooligosyltrehalose synthase
MPLKEVMTQSSNDSAENKHADPANRQSVEYNRTLTQLEALRTRSEFTSMKLTPWNEIWTSLTIAALRGNRRMVEVFYETLFEEAVFDDRGAWCLDMRRPG